LALTDHDTVDGIEEAHTAARRHGITLVPGVEISVTWSGRTIHIVGLDIDPADDGLRRGLDEVRAGRLQRAEAISARLAKLGVANALQGALALASNPATVSRTHFARHLVAVGAASNMASVFRRYLGEGKPAHVRHTWAALAQAVRWITEAGGVSVLAHPGRYGLRAQRLRALFQEFRAAGGVAVEVVCASHTADQAEAIAALASDCELLGSMGSDFHCPEESWLDLGRLARLPAQCQPIWGHPRLTRISALS